MILGFKRFFPDGSQTYFKEKILAGAGYGPVVTMPKIHTIRAGSRWHQGMSIQMAYGVRTKKYDQFNKGIEGLQICTGVQNIKIKWLNSTLITSAGSTKKKTFVVWIDGDRVVDKLPLLIVNDGFPSAESFCDWFNKDFGGQLIHWTDFKY